FGRIDLLINNAGINIPRLALDVTEEDWDKVLAVNLKGVFFGVQAALRAMGEQHSGSIVNMASAAIDHPAANLAVYSMAKAGVAILTRVAAQEGGPLGVRVNCVAPGYVVTPMTQRGEPERMEEVTAAMRRRSVLGAVGQPTDIANAVLYLACDASRFMTGQTLRPNGGTVMPA
ncbi:MAG: SDR family oxidoreductase, partial [Acidimicrobiia bacterium]|nr:SDR family oxidoreductase [Acidimicrobiia bacterium]